MRLLCSLPSKSDLCSCLRWEWTAGLPLKPPHWFWSQGAGVISPRLPHPHPTHTSSPGSLEALWELAISQR